MSVFSSQRLKILALLATIGAVNEGRERKRWQHDGDNSQVLADFLTTVQKICPGISAYKKSILRGAHIILADDGSVYDKFDKLGDTASGSVGTYRNSSHYPDQKIAAYYIEGSIHIAEVDRAVYIHLLVGKMVDEHARIHTWFQVERTPWRSPSHANISRQLLHMAGNVHNVVLHGKDYLVYRLTGKQVGALGLSEHNEQNAINVKCPAMPKFLGDHHPGRESRSGKKP